MTFFSFPGGPGTLPVPLIVPFALGRVSLNAHFGPASISPRLTPVSPRVSPPGTDTNEILFYKLMKIFELCLVRVARLKISPGFFIYTLILLL